MSSTSTCLVCADFASLSPSTSASRSLSLSLSLSPSPSLSRSAQLGDSTGNDRVTAR